jgi:hypothetical protein
LHVNAGGLAVLPTIVKVSFPVTSIAWELTPFRPRRRQPACPQFFKSGAPIEPSFPSSKEGNFRGLTVAFDPLSISATTIQRDRAFTVSANTYKLDKELRKSVHTLLANSVLAFPIKG